ncbi:MAG: winged helix-turn-helix domain-containing protein [Candidatus Bipolaricaulota bacterium]|nr:winged helix-turn-helix domain-containing protein [Candidatus Bipolaricaulota bacterium]MCS7274033.1 winged helix-turn-helix domain-containing protein [Candidatus Bipolaricaulota bacterium]MDW8110233.1 winged helix-turn-helix domain-containing protein [Candidatus Bipolaricaulota bacterium]
MNPRVRLWLILVGALALLASVTVGLYLKKTRDTLYGQFYERAAFRAQYLAALAERYQDSAATLERLLSTVFIATDVLYAQIVQGGEVVAEQERFEEMALPVERPDRVLVIRERRTVNNEAYWDVIYSLDRPEGSYVRLGLALAPFEQEWQRELLALLFVTVIFLGIASALLWWLTNFWAISTMSRDSPSLEPVTKDAALSRSSLPEAEVPDWTEQPERPAEPLRIDDLSKRVFVNGSEIKLSPKEYELLRLLASEPGRVFSNEEILRAVWAGRQWATAQDVKQYIYFLRKKIEADPEQPRYIITVRGFGYKLQF